MVFGGDKYPQILAATEKFTNGAGKNDPKASIIINISAMQGLVSTVTSMGFGAVWLSIYLGSQFRLYKCSMTHLLLLRGCLTIS